MRKVVNHQAYFSPPRSTQSHPCDIKYDMLEKLCFDMFVPKLLGRGDSQVPLSREVIHALDLEYPD